MSKQLYNEGRVVGLSAYELYVRHQLSQFPESSLPILTEREWLAASVGNGAAMILKLKSGTTAGVHDYPLPTNSILCNASSTITASLFNGTAAVDESTGWATKVTSYGPLISNTSSSSPTSSTNVPYQNLSTWDNANVTMLKEYMKIVDGICYMPGTWTASGTNPTKDFKPDYTKQSVIRLRLTKPLEKDVYIHLHGFIHTPIALGISKNDSSCLNSPKAQDGDFLGPAIYPWASKIFFTVPSEVMDILNRKAYVREFPDGATSTNVDTQALVDYDAADLSGFYTKYGKTSSQIPIDVKDINVIGDGVGVVGAYQRIDLNTANANYKGDAYPPILYGAKVTSKGTQKMSPIDTGAPYTLKFFEDANLAKNYPKAIPNVYALYRNSNKDIYVYDGNADHDSYPPITTTVDTINMGTTASPVYASSVTAKGETVKSISLINASGAALPLSTDSTTTSISDDYIGWKSLLEGLNLNKKINILGTLLLALKNDGYISVAKDASGNKTVTVNGKLKVTGNSEVAGNSTVGGTLRVTGAATFNSTASVGGKLTAKNDADVVGTLAVNKTSSNAEGNITSEGYMHATSYVKTDSYAVVNGTNSSGYNIITDDDELKFSKPPKSSTQYIVLNNGLRLYISNTQPGTSGVPIGSIGIGW